MNHIWKGRKYLKLENCRSPWYTTMNGRDICIKHYFTIFGWSLALRMVKTGYSFGAFIKAKTMFGHVSETLSKNILDDSEAFKGFEKSLLAKGEYNTLYCYNKDGHLLGSIDDLNWMFKNNCIADDVLRGVAYCKDDKSFVGYSHRGKQKFKVGDKLFDQKYKPVEEDYEEWEWAGFIQEQSKAQKNNEDNGWDEEVSIQDVIPFSKRGSIIIKTQSQARKAAHNFSKYIS